MNEPIKVHYKDMHYVFITDYYDGPLAGTCMLDGQLHRFEGIPYPEDNWEYYDVFPMTLFEKIKAKLNQYLFEICVGTHWSYDGNTRTSYYYIRRPEWLHRFTHKVYFYVRKKLVK